MGRVTKGWPKLSDYADDYVDDVQKRAKEIVLETTQLIVSTAKALAPVDEGELRDSIIYTVLDGGFSTVINVGAEHAVYVNYGTGIYAEGPGGSSAKKIPWSYWSPKLNRFVTTKGMRAQEFWEPAIEVGERHFIREMRRF